MIREGKGKMAWERDVGIARAYHINGLGAKVQLTTMGQFDVQSSFPRKFFWSSLV